MTTKNSMLFFATICAILLALSGICSYAANLVPENSFENWTVGDTHDSEYTQGCWRFFANSNGNLEVVSDAQDGTRAIKLTRTSTDGDTGFGLWNTYGHYHLVPVTPGKRYIVRFWAKSDDVTSPTLKFQMASYGAQASTSDSGHLEDTLYTTVYPTSKWAVYQTTYTAPANLDVTHADFSFRVLTVGSVIIDNCSMEEEDTAVGENLFADPELDSFIVGTSNSSTTSTDAGSCRWFNTYVGYGSMAVVDADGTGDPAVTLTLLTAASSSKDTGLGLKTTCPNANIPIISGHTYKASIIARAPLDSTETNTADDPYIRVTLATYKYFDVAASGSYIRDMVSGWAIPEDGEWHTFSYNYTITDAYAAYGNLSFRPRRIGSADIDYVSFVDITSCTVTGTVTNPLTGSAISGATVTFTGDQTVTATTDPTGAYTASVPRGYYDISASASGFDTRTLSSVAIAEATAKDFALMPQSTSWNIYDTFTRDDNTDLGTTEDSYAIPWVANANGSVSISNDTLYSSNTGTVNNGVFLGRGFAPTDFDLSVTATMNEFDRSSWFGISYREDTIGTADDGYVVQVWPWGCGGNQYPVVNLWCNGGRVLDDIDVSSYLYTDGTPNTMTLTVRGNAQVFCLNGNSIFDIVDSTKANGGYVGLFCDSYNVIAWDDFNVSYNVPVSGSTGDIKDLSDGTAVKATDAVVTGVYDGFFYIEDTNRVAGIKVVSTKAVNIDDVVNVEGTLGTENGEKYIDAKVITVGSTSSIEPLGMAGKSVSSGLSAVGLLVKAWGNVTYVNYDDGYCYIDDGSGLNDGSGYTGVKVIITDLSDPFSIAEDSYYTVTGVLGMSDSGCVIYPQTSDSMVQ